VIDLQKPVSAPKFGSLTGLSERRVQALKAAGVLIGHSSGRGLDGVASIRSYCEHLRERAAGRASREAGRLDLKQETARLKVSQRKHIDLKNSVIEGSHVPLSALRPAWGRIMRAVRGGILAAPGKIRFSLPHLSPHDQQVIDDVLRDVLTEISETPPPPDEDCRE
jgi:phage terminase Nu1 subunit (DNA packaging protein)